MKDGDWERRDLRRSRRCGSYDTVMFRQRRRMRCYAFFRTGISIDRWDYQNCDSSLERNDVGLADGLQFPARQSAEERCRLRINRIRFELSGENFEVLEDSKTEEMANIEGEGTCRCDLHVERSTHE